MSPLDQAKKERLIDEILTKHFPTLAVPHHPIPEAPQGTSRLLMASDGLYIDTNQKWGAFRKKIWHSPAQLPYGALTERDTFTGALQAALQILASEFITTIMQNARDGLEWYGAIGWHDGEFAPMQAKTAATPLSVTYQIATNHAQQILVADIHSHLGQPMFSPTDDNDDTEGVKIAIVVGDTLREQGTIPTRSRYCINRFLLEEKTWEINIRERK